MTTTDEKRGSDGIFAAGEALRPRLGEGFEAWLGRLGGPARFDVPGADPSRCRVVVTLSHGNESSGARAVHAMLLEGLTPAVNLSFFLLSVEAALTEPHFTHRRMPGRRDQNRCFAAPHGDDAEGRRAEALLAAVKTLAPEALLDVHNTSSDGPAYGVATGESEAQLALCALFSEHLIVTDLRLGALMEAFEGDIPIVTIECGGADDGRSHGVGLEGLRDFAKAPDVLHLDARHPAPQILRHPVRVTLAPGVRVSYGECEVSDPDLVLQKDIHRHNFDPVGPGDVLGRLTRGDLGILRSVRADGRDITHELFAIDDGQLRPRGTMDLLMVTTDPRIAQQDCLFYAVPVISGG